MSLRPMSVPQAALVLELHKEFGTQFRFRDIEKFRVKAKEGVSYIFNRSKKLKRGVFDFSAAVEAAKAVQAGQSDPSAKAVKVKAVKVAKPAKVKAVKVKAEKPAKAVKVKAVKVTPTVLPVAGPDAQALINLIDGMTASK